MNEDQVTGQVKNNLTKYFLELVSQDDARILSIEETKSLKQEILRLEKLLSKLGEYPALQTIQIAQELADRCPNASKFLPLILGLQRATSSSVSASTKKELEII